MKKEKVVELVFEICLYFIVVLLLSFLFHQLGWLNIPVLSNAFYLTVGWCIWKILSYFISKYTRGN